MCICQFGQAQANLDSLFSVWNDTSQPNEGRYEAYSSYIVNGYLYSRPDSAIILSQSLEDFAKISGIKKAEAIAYHIQGIASYNMGNYTAALDDYLKASKAYESIGDKVGYGACLNNIGTIYDEQENYEQSLAYFEQALESFEDSDLKHQYAITLGNIGLSYSNLDSLDLALDYNFRALSISEEEGDKEVKSVTLGNLGDIYYRYEIFEDALESYNKALTLFEELNDLTKKSNALASLGNIHLKLEDVKKAIDYCNLGLNLAIEIDERGNQMSAYGCLYQGYKDLNQANNSLAYLEKLREVETQIQDDETSKVLANMEYRRVIYLDSISKLEEARLIEEAHQAEIREKDRVRDVFIGSTFIFILIAGGVFNRWRYVNKAKNIIGQERDRSENLLLNILPAEITAELKEKGHAEARNFDNVSILFSDFKDFTKLSAKLSASDLVNEINYCFKGFDAIMEKYGIEKIKTNGDEYMAAGGIPVPQETSTKNTILAALEMQAFIAQRKTENDALGHPAFEMRVGVHTGPVVAGIVGDKKFQYDVWGDTVNTASRIESGGEIRKVNISQNTYFLLKDDPEFVFEHRGKIEAKGKGKVDMYFIKKASLDQ